MTSAYAIRHTERAAHKVTPETIAAASDPDALLTIELVEALTGFSETTIRRMMKKGTFPVPRKFNRSLVRWRAGEVRNWLKANETDPLQIKLPV